MSRIVLALLLAATFVIAVSPAAASEALSMSVRPGFDGMVRAGGWLPIYLEVDNRGGDIVGVLETQVDEVKRKPSESIPPVTTRIPAVLPRFSHKRFVMDVYVPSINSQVVTRLVDRDGRVLLERNVPLDPVPSGELLCGVLSRTPSALAFLPSVSLSARQRNSRLATLDLSDIPDRSQALSTLDCLIMSNLGSGGLTQKQQSALQAWIATGGMLIVAGGPSWQKLAANLPASLLPVKMTGTTSLTRAVSLSEFAREPLKESGPWLASSAVVTDGTVIVQEGEVPLLVGARRGEGSVFYLALDPAAEPLLSWAGREQMWRYLLSSASAAAASPASASRQYLGWGSVPERALMEFAPVRTNAGRALGVLGLAYLVTLALVGFLTFRRTRRIGWSMSLALSTIAIATGATFRMASEYRNPDVMLNQITIVRAWSDGPTVAHSYVSASAPQGFRADISSPPDSLVSSLSFPSGRYGSTAAPDWSLKVTDQGETTINDFDISKGLIASYQVDTQMSISPLSADLRVNQGELEGKIRNLSSSPLEDVAIVIGNQVTKVGALGARQSVPVKVSLPKTTSSGYLNVSSVVSALSSDDNGNQTDEARARNEIASSALNPSYKFHASVGLGAVSVVAWSTEGPIPTAFEGAKVANVDRTLLVATLPVLLNPGDYSVLPPSLVVRRPLSVSAGDNVDSTKVILATGESIATEYTLPAGQNQFLVNSLGIEVSGQLYRSGEDTRGQNPVSISDSLGSALIFDWRTSDWVEVPIHLGENNLAEPQRFVSPLGTVRLRYTFRLGMNDVEPNRFDIGTFDIRVGGLAR